MSIPADLVEAIGEELRINQADVGSSAEQIAESIIGWTGSPESHSSRWISYGTSAALGTSLQIAIVTPGVLFDFEFAEKRQHIYVVAIAKIDTMIMDTGPVAAGDVWRARLHVTAGERSAIYETVGDLRRTELLLAFYRGLVSAWQQING